ncbi:MAG: L-aspartate oxidase [Bacillota bacterium]|nr:L-aspartate oxidase [Bacillota bacterium]
MRRYLVERGVKAEETLSFDTVIIGSGIAGLYAALNLDKRLSCAILTKEGVDISNSWLAQGGIAAAVSPGDKPQFHFEDTITAGAGLCNEKAVRVLVDEGPQDIASLVKLNVPFDLDEDGDLQTGREGGHRRNRIVHAHGDATGRETVKTLAAIASARENITFIQNVFLIDILTDDNRASGVLVYQDGYRIIAARNIIMCTGGIGQLYIHSTNPSIATGDGLAAAMRAGVPLANMEFIQFHPTGLYCKEPESRSFLISEAVRGEGGILINDNGERFMLGQHPMNELAPRDIVARGIMREMVRSGKDHVFLDITKESKEFLSLRFPTIYGECLKRGIDISETPIPVCPVQHYLMGGIVTDLNGMTKITGLYACGEAAYTGVHGANRLASNSMLECLVFGRRAAQHISGQAVSGSISLPAFPEPEKTEECEIDVLRLKKLIRETMSRDGWVIRRKADMEAGLKEINRLKESLETCTLKSKSLMETLNMATVGVQILTAALGRRESVGAHYRED